MADYLVTAIPASVQQAIKLRAASYYANREEFGGGAAAAPAWFTQILSTSIGRSNIFGLTGSSY